MMTSGEAHRTIKGENQTKFWEPYQGAYISSSHWVTCKPGAQVAPSPGDCWCGAHRGLCLGDCWCGAHTGLCLSDCWCGDQTGLSWSLLMWWSEFLCHESSGEMEYLLMFQCFSSICFLMKQCFSRRNLCGIQRRLPLLLSEWCWVLLCFRPVCVVQSKKV